METKFASCCLSNNPAPSIFEPLSTNTITSSSYTKAQFNTDQSAYVYSISYNKYSASSSGSTAVAAQAFPHSKPNFTDSSNHDQYDQILEKTRSLSKYYTQAAPNCSINSITNCNTIIAADEYINPTITKAHSLFDLRRSSSDKLHRNQQHADAVDVDDDGSVASKLLPSISKSISSPSLLACCKESVRETPYQKALKLKAMKLHHCAEELGSESSETISSQDSVSSSSSVASFDEYNKQHTQSSSSFSQRNQLHAHHDTQNTANKSSMRSVRSSPSLSSYNNRSSTTTSFLSSPKQPTLTRVKSFPPPLSHTLPESNLGSISEHSDLFSVSLCSYREHGRFILKEVRVPTRQFFAAQRSNGRLTLHILTREDKPLHSDSCDDEDVSPKDAPYVNNHAINEEMEEDSEQSVMSITEDEASTSNGGSYVVCDGGGLSQNYDQQNAKLDQSFIGCGTEQDGELLIATFETQKRLSNLEPDVFKDASNGNISKVIAVKMKNQNSGAAADHGKLKTSMAVEKKPSSLLGSEVAIADAMVQAGCGIDSYSNDILEDKTSVIWTAESNEFSPKTVGYPAAGLPISASTTFVRLNDSDVIDGKWLMDVVYMLLSSATLVNSGKGTCQESWHKDNNCNTVINEDNCFGASCGHGIIKAAVMSGCGRNILNYDIMKISAVPSISAYYSEQGIHYNNYAMLQSVGKEQSILHNLHCKELNFDRLQQFSVAGIKAGAYVAIHS